METFKTLCTGRNRKGMILRMFAIPLVRPGVGSPCRFPSFRDAFKRKRHCPQRIATKEEENVLFLIIVTLVCVTVTENIILCELIYFYHL